MGQMFVVEGFGESIVVERIGEGESCLPSFSPICHKLGTYPMRPYFPWRRELSPKADYFPTLATSEESVNQAHLESSL